MSVRLGAGGANKAESLRINLTSTLTPVGKQSKTIKCTLHPTSTREEGGMGRSPYCSESLVLCPTNITYNMAAPDPESWPHAHPEPSRSAPCAPHPGAPRAGRARELRPLAGPARGPRAARADAPAV